MDWGFVNCLDRFAYRKKDKIFCLECGHSWVDQLPLLTSIDDGCTCPECGMDLKLKHNYQSGMSVAAYFAVITTKNDFQVVRMVKVKKSLKPNTPAYCLGYEVMQHWINTEGELTTMSKNVNAMSMYYDLWAETSNMEVRVPSSQKAEMRHNLSPYKIHPGSKAIPIIKRNGFNGHFYGFNPKFMFQLLIKDPKLETILKAGQTSLVNYCGKEDSTEKVAKRWSSVKICIRNGYKIPDASIWFDHLDLLEEAGKDLRSPKYICPKNLKEEHGQIVSKIKRLKTEADQKAYVQRVGSLLAIRFKDELINVKVLQSIDEFEQEAKALQHCVFSNKYFNRAGSLIMSARIGKERLETVELSLSKMKVVQSRGINNTNTIYHNRIIDLVERNIKQIQKRQKIAV